LKLNNSGSKKWITGGMYADYFSTAVMTPKGMTMMLIERQEGVITRKIKTSYSPTAGTAYIELENVKVPNGNVLGQVDKGIPCVLANSARIHGCHEQL
jgi:alkylation response protein AidB-like acyl-CoA dehydrogenase